MSKTPRTPRSRTPSRVGTPIRITGGTSGSPSRLIPPVPRLHSAPSVSSLRVHSAGYNSTIQTPISTSPPNSSIHGDSSSSSAVNVNQTEGILIQEPEVEVEATSGEDGTAGAHIENTALDDVARRQLRDHLRRTLTDTDASVAESGVRPSRHRAKSIEGDEVHIHADSYPPRQYFVLTDAGKPVFVSRQEVEESEAFTSMMGLMQALISVFLDDGDKIRCINAGKNRISFLLRPPLYYACVSAWGEPESVTRFHLEYLHLQIISVVSAEQLRRMFERRGNFDLRRLLSGAERFMHSLLARLEFDLAMSTSSLSCLRIDPNLRKAVADVLVPTSKIKDVLYMILLAQGRVITLVRPKKHSIHPSDIHILVNTIHAPSIVNSSASASWLPICLPKFNSSAFVNAYVTFMRHGQASVDDTAPMSPTVSASVQGESEETVVAQDGSVETEGSEPSSTSERPPTPHHAPEFGLVCVSGQADFEAVRSWCTSVTEKLEREGLLKAMTDAMHKGKTTYTVSDLSIPGLRHFVYKSRPHVQVTMPEYDEPYNDNNEKRRLITLYQILHDNIHAKSGQESTLKLQYIRTEHESVMGWITQPFELYLALSPLIPKSAAINAANAIARWVSKEEKRLFLRDAPVF
ncbi:trafficking protein Mon1-domain-containing protein [Cristinia sonorae]|uniref:Vacuolar fusion protein MON1 n=1 Tax=Cristinia sonorae TaxID=1940300 RepID=A0A8K0XSS4_9AGAR|nr:trafficking protein Mon1-domain-containing protein [Cristinia sonorae]